MLKLRNTGNATGLYRHAMAKSYLIRKENTMSRNSMALLQQTWEVAAVAAVHSFNAYRAVTCKTEIKPVSRVKVPKNWEKLSDWLVEVIGEYLEPPENTK
jgi:hypothetical protein